MANAAHVKNVPGRKTDVNDACGLADLLAHGLIPGSFVPDEPIQNCATCCGLASSSYASVAATYFHSDYPGGRQHQTGLGHFGRHRPVRPGHDRGCDRGRERPGQIGGSLAHRRPQSLLSRAAGGAARPDTSHHRFRLQIHLQQIDALSAAIAQIDQEADGKLEPFRAAAPLLSSIPGVGELSAQTIIAEIGADMRRFPTHAHLISWAELAKVPLA